MLETSDGNTAAKIGAYNYGDVETDFALFSCPITMRKGHKYTFQFDTACKLTGA